MTEGGEARMETAGGKKEEEEEERSRGQSTVGEAGISEERR